MESKITIDLKKIELAVNQAGDIIFTPEAEKHIQLLLDTQAKLDELVKQAKDIIEAKGLEYNENFNGVVSDSFKVGYRMFGSRYSLDESRVNEIPEEVYKKEIKYSPIAEAIDAYYEQHGSLPLGVNEKERKKQITITAKNAGSVDE